MIIGIRLHARNVLSPPFSRAGHEDAEWRALWTVGANVLLDTR